MSDRATRAYIPPNLSETGGLLGGILKTRNTIEAVICIGFVYIFGKLLSLFLPYIFCVAVTIILGIFLAVVAIIGINGEPLSTWFLNIVNYRKTSGYIPMRFPMPEYVNEENTKGGNSSFIDDKLEQLFNATKKS